MRFFPFSSNRFQGLALGILAALGFLSPALPASAGTCTVDATQTNQFIHCIGASSAWSNIGSLGQALFADDNVNGHIGISSLRARIDPTNNFSPEVSQLATAHSINPNVLLWATEWSPPAQYKANGNVDGGASNDTFLGASSGSPNSADTGLASYQVSFIQYCQSHGAPLYALSIQNEPNFNPTYEACLWTAGQFDVYAQAFHTALQNAGLSTKIMLPEPDNTFGMNLAATAMDDSIVAPMVGIIGTHLYGSPNPAPLASFGFTHVTNQEWWETEMSGNTTDIPGALQEADWIQNSLVNSNMNAFHYWWLTDLISNNTLTIKAYVLGNYSKFIRPGYYRMGATAVPSSGVSVSAFKNTNTSSPQTIVFVAINSNSGTTSQTFSINGVNVTSVVPWVTDSSNNLVQKSAVSVSGNSFTYNLTGSSVTSFVGVVSGTSAPTATKTNTPVPPTPTKTNTPAAPTATSTNTPVPPTATRTATAVPPTATPTQVVASIWRVNAGGPAYTDSLGNVWAADENFNGGSTIAQGSVTGTADPTLYGTQRYGTFSYSFAVPAGSYQVTLKLAETFSGDFAAGDRVFNISVNGTTAFSNLDIFAQVGANAPDDKIISNVTPVNGLITIQFTGGTSTDVSAVVEGLQVIPQPAATATPTKTNVPATATSTASPTVTSTLSPTGTATASKTATAVPPTATNTSVPSTASPTGTATFTFTSTVTSTATVTSTPTATHTPAPPTSTNTPAPPTDTPTITLTPTETPVPPTATVTNTAVPPTATKTATWTATVTNTLTVTSTRTVTPVPPTASPTSSATNTPIPPTATNTLPPTATNTPATGTGSLKVQLLSGVTSDSTNSPHPQIQVVNTGTGPLSLNNVTVRYWFNCDCTGQSIQTWVDWAGWMPFGQTVTGDVQVSAQTTSLGGQTGYILYTFTGNLVLQPGQSIQVQSRFNKSDWSNMLQDNDWSYAANTAFADDSKITGYVSGALVWGSEPVAAAAPALQVSSAVAYPNPSTGSGTTLDFTLSGGSSGTLTDSSAKITLAVYTTGSRQIWTETLPAGTYGTTGQHDVYWNEQDLQGSGLSNGVYYLRVSVTSHGQTTSSTSRILILR